MNKNKDEKDKAENKATREVLLDDATLNEIASDKSSDTTEEDDETREDDEE